MNSWQTFPILSVPNDAPIVEVRNPNHFVQPFVFVAFFVIFCGDQSWFYGMLWISDGYRCSFTQDFHHFLSFPPLFPNVSMISKALRLRGCQEVASQPRYTKSIHIYYIYICVYIAVWVVSSCAQLLKKHCVGLDTETCGRRQWRPETLDG